LKNQVLDCDIIIFDFEESDLDEIQFASKILKYQNFDDQKIFIFISTCLTWSKTLNKTNS